MRNTNLPRNQFATSPQVPVWSWLLPLVPLSLWLITALATSPATLFLFANQTTRALPDTVWVFFDLLGNGWYVFSLASPLLILAPRILVSGVCAGAIAGGLGRLLKLSLQMPRPAAVLDPSTFYILGKPLTSLSMPSGHTLTAFALATAFYFSASPEKRKPYLWLFGLAIAAGIARMAVGAHWSGDVLAGAGLGILGGVAGAHLGTYVPERLLKPTAWLTRLLALCTILCIYMLVTKEIDFTQSYPFQLGAAAIAAISLLLFVRKSLARNLSGF